MFSEKSVSGVLNGVTLKIFGASPQGSISAPLLLELCAVVLMYFIRAQESGQSPCLMSECLNVYIHD